MGGAAKDGMKIKSFEFNLRELAGSMGDFGTLFPLAIGYIAVCGLDPAGFLVMMGLANIATGLIYKLPMPIEPMKVLAVVAIAQHWTPSLDLRLGLRDGDRLGPLCGDGDHRPPREDHPPFRRPGDPGDARDTPRRRGGQDDLDRLGSRRSSRSRSSLFSGRAATPRPPSS